MLGHHFSPDWQQRIFTIEHNQMSDLSIVYPLYMGSVQDYEGHSFLNLIFLNLFILTNFDIAFWGNKSYSFLKCFATPTVSIFYKLSDCCTTFLPVQLNFHNLVLLNAVKARFLFIVDGNGVIFANMEPRKNVLLSGKLIQSEILSFNEMVIHARKEV